MDKKLEIAMVVVGTVLTGGLFYGCRQLYKKGYEDGAAAVGKMIFDGELTVDVTDEDGKVETKVVDPVLRNPEDVIIEDYSKVDVTYH